MGQLDIPSPETPFTMPAGMTDKDLERLQALVPLHTLPEARFEELVEDLKFVKAARGEVLFSQGDTDHEHVYLLEGSIALLDKGREIDRVEAGSDTARFPIAHQLPRRNGARTAVPSRLVRIDSRRLSELLARSEHVDYEVSDLQDEVEGDWMGQMLRSRILQQIPAANIQNVMMRVERVAFKEGDLVIRQGDPGDAYYMLSSGRALVTRELDPDKPPLELARLGPGDAFGEEALLSDAPRNSTISMLTDGALLRLSKDDFLEFIKRPLLRTLTFADADSKVDKGAVWLDVRPRAEYETSHLPNSINLPFEALRYQASSLDRDRQYVACSNTGSQAVSAAFLLTERGFEVSVLRGGLTAAELERDRSEAGSDAADTDAPGGGEERFARRAAEATAQAQALKARLDEMEREQHAVILAGQQREDELKKKLDRLNLELSLAIKQSDALNDAQELGKDELIDLNERFNFEQSEGRKARARVSELEVIEIQLRQKLEKLERNLIGERERAEAADEALDSLNRRLTDLQAERDHERERWSHESGQLKEQVTDLQAQLDLTHQDLDEVRSGQSFLASNELAELKQQQQSLTAELKQRTEQQQRSQAEYDQAQARIAELEKTFEQLEAEHQKLLQEKTELSEARAAAGDQQRQQEEKAQADQARIAEMEQALREANEARERVEHEQAELRRQQRDAIEQTADLQQRVDAAQSLIADLKQALTEFKAEREQWQHERDELLEQQGRLNSERDEYLQRAESAETRTKELEGRLEALQGTSAEVEARLNELQSEHGQTTAERERLEAELLAARNELDSLREAHQSLGLQEQEYAERLSAETSAAAAERDKSARLEQRIGELEQHLAEVQSQLEQHQARERELDENGQELQSQLASLEQEKTALGEQLAAEQQASRDEREQRIAGEARAAEFEKEVDQLRTELQTQQDRGDALDSERQTLVDAVSALEEDKSTLAGQLADERQALAGEREQHGAAEQRVTELERLLDQSQVELQTLTKHEDELTRTHRELVDTLAALETEKAELSDHLDVEQESILTERTQRSAAEQRVVELEQLLEQSRSELQAQVTQHDELEQERLALEDRLHALEQEKAELNQHLGADRESIAAERDGRVAAEERTAELEKTVAQIRAELESLGTEHAELQGERQTVGVDLERLHKDKTALEDQLAAEQQAAKVARERVVALESQMVGLTAQLEHTGNEKLGLAEQTERLQAELAANEELQRRLQELEQALAGEEQRAGSLRTEADAAATRLQQELESAENNQQRLQSDFDQVEHERDDLRRELTELRERASIDDLRPQLEQAFDERDQARAQAEHLAAQVRELRAVMEQYVEEIQGAQSGGERLQALQAELEMVREQAARDVASLRRELAAVAQHGEQRRSNVQ